MIKEIDEKASLVRQRLNNDEIIIKLIEEMQSSLNNKITLNEKCDILNGLGIIYFLYSELFKKPTDNEMLIVRNSILRFHFLTGINITDEDSLNDFNNNIDDKNIYVINSDLFENTNFPFLMSYNQEGWLIKRISPGSVYYYTISKSGNNWKILNHKHGHNPFNFENHLLSILSECLTTKFKQVIMKDSNGNVLKKYDRVNLKGKDGIFVAAALNENNGTAIFRKADSDEETNYIDSTLCTIMGLRF